MAEITDSILNSVKDAIGPAEDYEAFDQELIIFINSAFAQLNQLGVGPENEFSITGDTEVWTDFDPEISNMVQSYIVKKVRLAFDPPSSSYVLTAMKEEADKLEWRLMAKAELERRNSGG